MNTRTRSTRPSRSPGNGLVPLEASLILVDAILDFEKAETVREKLADAGIQRGIRTVMVWLNEARGWLGLTDFYPRANIPSYRESVEKWIAENGRPTARQIHAMRALAPSDRIAC